MKKLRIFTQGLIFAALLPMLGLAACGPAVKKVDFKSFPEISDDAVPAPVMFGNFRSALPVGADAGGISMEENWCGWPYDPVGRHFVRGVMDLRALRDGFHDTLEGQGYDVTGGPDVFEDEEDEEMLRSEYRINARLVDARMKGCFRDPDSIDALLFGRPGVKGELYVAVEWGVFDTLRRTTVYKTRTEGYANRSVPNYEGATLLFLDAFSMAAHNLGSDPAFRDMVFFNQAPDESLWKKTAPSDDRPRQFDPRERVDLPPIPLSTQSLEGGAERVRKAAVMVQAGVGHGSGFFITDRGHILTNRHVVGDAQRVRIVLADKKKALTAEVLRSDPARDVALLKLEELPEDGLKNIPLLPIRRDWPAVSEPVYAIGAPTLTRLQDTVTKGIISAHRRHFKSGLGRENFLQSDVMIHGGNSGGPLLDRNGNLVGMTVAGYDQPGLNLFIPIDEALDRLSIGKDMPDDAHGPLAGNDPVSLTP